MTPEEKTCLKGLFITDPEEDKNALKRRKGDRTPGTCDWIFETHELKSWLGETEVEPQNQPNLLWLHGFPGTGKSTMAITLAEELPKKIFLSVNSGTLAYFFCDSNFEERKTATAILRGLLYQLIKQNPRLLQFLQLRYEERKETLFKSFDALWALFIDIAKDKATGKKYFIIDALDECDQESREIFLKQLNQTFLHHNLDLSNLHMLITSRPYPEIVEELGVFNNKELSSFDKSTQDIEMFIQQKVADFKTKKRYTTKIAAKISQILTEKAEGTFLWVGIACE
jgi:DNA polymerase III delta prime subunit